MLEMFKIWKYDWANPEYGYLALILPVLAVYYYLNYNHWNGNLKISSLRNFQGSGDVVLAWIKNNLVIVKWLGIGSLIVALARPQISNSWQSINQEGIDIVMAIDISGSMLSKDFRPNRLEASKKVAQKFVKKRPNDRIGLVIYGGKSFTQCPLTSDHTILNKLFNEVKYGLIQDGTAIGEGLATAVNRLRESDAKSKVVILLTDGSNNQGSVTPVTAAEIAHTMDVKVYTIGVGTNGKAKTPIAKKVNGELIYDYREVKIDEKTLKAIAKKTGGRYFRATDNKKLNEIYDEIDKLEKTAFEVYSFQKPEDAFMPWIILGCVFLLFEYILQYTLFRSLT